MSESGVSSETSGEKATKSWRFWAIFSALAFTNLLAGLEGTITAATLPSIVAELDSGADYVWIVNGYLLTYTAFLPLYGQSAAVLGRRWPTISAIALFLLGSAICGAAPTTNVLIAGRLVQGIGAAGISSLTQLIVSDLVSPRERGSYVGIIYAVAGVGSSLGPPVGGAIVQYHGFRWIFYLNLPIGGVALVAHLLCLRVGPVDQGDGKTTLVQKLVGGIDWLGNLLMMGSIVCILLALSWADTLFTWSSWQVILPMVFGFAGLASFFVYEGSPLFKRLCPRGPPTIPPRMFANRTSFAALTSTFLAAILTMWRIYFLPVYFQAVLLLSPSRSGVLLLPTIIVGMFMAVVAGVVLSRFGRYKPIHIFGFSVATLASGLYVSLDDRSSLAQVVLYQVVAAMGGASLMTTLLPAVQASHPSKDMVATTTTWTFVQAFGGLWGLTIPAAIFNSQFDSQLINITDETVRKTLGGGDAYSHVSASYISSLEPTIRAEVVAAYLNSLKCVWVVCLGFNIVGAMLVFLEKEIPLSTTLESDYKIEEKMSISEIDITRTSTISKDVP